MMSDFGKQTVSGKRQLNLAPARLKDEKVLGYKEPLDEVYSGLYDSKYFIKSFVGIKDYHRQYPVPLTVFGVARAKGQQGMKLIEFDVYNNNESDNYKEFLSDVFDYEQTKDPNLEAHIQSNLGQTALRQVPLPRGLFAALEVRNAHKGSQKEAVLFTPKSVSLSVMGIKESLQKLADLSSNSSARARVDFYNNEDPEGTAQKLALSALYNVLKPKLV